MPAARPSAATPRDGSTTPPLSMAPAQDSSFVFRLVLLPPFWSYGELPREMHFSRDTGTIRVGRLDPGGVSPGRVWANAGFTGERGKLASAQHAELQLVATGNVLLTSWSRNGTYIKAEVEWMARDRSPTALSAMVRVAAGEWFQLIGPAAASFKATAMLEPERRYTVCFGRPMQGSSILPLQYSLSGDAAPAAAPCATAAPTAAAQQEQPPASSREAQPARVGAKLPVGIAESYLARQGAGVAACRLSVDTLLAGQTAAGPAAAERDDTARNGAPSSPSLRRVSAPHAPPDDYDSADDYDGDFFKSQEDRQEVQNMTEIDREMLMAQRYDKQMRRREVLEMRERLREQREARLPRTPSMASEAGGGRDLHRGSQAGASVPQGPTSAPARPKAEPAPASASMQKKEIREKDVVEVIYEHGRMSLKELGDKFKPLMSTKADRADFTAIIAKVTRALDEDGTLVTLNDSALNRHGLHDIVTASRLPAAAVAEASWRASSNPSTGLRVSTGASSSAAAGSTQVAHATARPSPRPSPRPLRRIIDDDNSDDDFEASPAVPSRASAQPAAPSSSHPWNGDGDDDGDDDGDGDGDEEVDDADPVSGFSSHSSGVPSPRVGEPSKAFRIPRRGGGGGGASGGAASAAGAGSGSGGGAGSGGGGGNAGLGPGGDAALRRPWPGATPQGTTPQEWPQEAGDGEPVPGFVMGLEAEACWRALKRLGRVPESAVVEMSDLHGRTQYNKLAHDQQELLLHWVHFTRRGTGAKQREYSQFAGPDGYGGVHVKDSVPKAVEAARARAPASTRGIKGSQGKATKAAAPKPEATAEARAPKSSSGAAIALPEGDLMPLGKIHQKRRAEVAFGPRVAVLGGLDTHVAAVKDEPEPPCCTAEPLACKPEPFACKPEPPSCTPQPPSCTPPPFECKPEPLPLAPAPAPAPPPLVKKKSRLFGLESSDEDSDAEGE